MSSVLTNFRIAFDTRYFRLSLGNLSLLTFVWLLVGFAMGTALLLGPVRWVATALEGHPSKELLERSAVVAIILFLIVVSHWISLVIVRALVRMRPRNRPLLLAVPIVAAAAAYVLWVNPVALRGFMGDEQQISSQFTFGPYPTLEKLYELEERGFTGVVSLLHPAVVPFEPQLIARERADAATVGLRFIHIPMLPWVSDNTEAIRRIKQVAADESGRFYVHCYLGKDRTHLFQKIVEEVAPERASENKRARPFEKEKLERGVVVSLPDDVHIAPLPVEEEMWHIIYRDVRNVVSLMDPERDSDRRWIEEERELLARNAVPFRLLPISTKPFNPESALQAAREVRKMQKPLIVHSFHALDSGKAPASEAFLQAYVSDRLPLPPSVFERGMANGRPRVIAPGIAVGPRPEESEFDGHLASRGARTVIYAGPAGGAMERDETAARTAGLDWVAMQGNPESWYEFLEKNGPIYLYGPEAEAAAIMIERDLGPALPGLPADAGSQSPVLGSQ